MKRIQIHSIILVFVVALGIFLGTNLNEIDSEYTESTKSKVVEEPTISKEEQLKQINKFYNYVYECLMVFEKIDKNFEDIENSRVSRVQLYEYFSNLENLMEEGQRKPIGNAIPQGLDDSQKELFDMVVDELRNAFQYRKFAYRGYLEYLDTNKLKTLEEGKKWLNDAYISAVSATISLGYIKEEYNLSTENKDELD